MARSNKEDPLYGDMQHCWNYRPDGTESGPGCVEEVQQQSATTSDGILGENNLFASTNSYTNSEVFDNKHAFNVNGDNIVNDENLNFANLQNVPRVNNLQKYGALNLGNGQLVRVYYDENNQQFMIPVTGNYEYLGNGGSRDSSSHNSSPNIFNTNQEFNVNGNSISPSPTQNSNCSNEHLNMPTSNFLKEVLGNWTPNSSGTYSPFGQNNPLKHPHAPMSIHQNSSPMMDTITPPIHKQEFGCPKRNENSPLADTSTKKRIVAEVKPMRPSYSDVLAKNAKNNPPDNLRKIPTPPITETKASNKSKADKQSGSNAKQGSDEKKNKSDKKVNANTISSGSESGDVTVEELDKQDKPSKKNRNKRSNLTSKWSSIEDLSNGHTNNQNSSQFVFIENHSEKKKDKKFNDKFKQSKKNSNESDFIFDDDYDDEEDVSQFVLQEGQAEGSKVRKKKESRTLGSKAGKTAPDKKKTQVKSKRNKPGYLGVVQNYLEQLMEIWGGATWKAVLWFFYLLSDICRMSAHLSFDICTSIFTQTYVSSQAVWRSSKDGIKKLIKNKFVLYIDKRFGPTKFGFWRKLKWFKKDVDSSSDAKKVNSNIPLPATGEEAMKRLLACKGKDPYSILGVSVTCTDDEIKHYYRRQAFLVHPDKNQQPGAEEAFKILQHAFDIIGEPQRREAYERRTLESRNVEAAWSELSTLLTQLHDKMEVAANTIRCTNCGRRHKRVATDRPCYAARYCMQCKIRHSAKEGDIWAESSMMGLLVMYYACMDGAVYQITQWASCQKKNLKQLRPDSHVVQYRIVLGSKANTEPNRPPPNSQDPNLEEFINNLYNKNSNKLPADDAKRARRNKKTKSN